MEKKTESFELSLRKSTDLNQLKSRIDKKRIGQYFSSENLAKQMVNMIELKTNTSIKVLDPGAGTGILIAALVNRIIVEDLKINIQLHLYEIDEKCISELNSVMKICKKDMEDRDNNFSYKIFNEDYLLCEDYNDYYDLVISNPPYFKLNKAHPYSFKFGEFIFGQGNIYYLFMIEAIRNLSENGQFLFVTPRSFTSGVYFKKFRRYLVENMNIIQFHLFESRSDIFTNEKVLQESLITKGVKSKLQSESILISSSKNTLQVAVENEISVNKKSVLTEDEHNYSIRVPTSYKEKEILDKIDSYNNNLEKMGFTVSTGPIVPFRHKSIIGSLNSDYNIPLLFMSNLNEKNICGQSNLIYGISEKESNSNLYFKMQNMILIKRLSNKEQKSRLMISLLLKKNFKYNFVTFENHVNYIMMKNASPAIELLNGIICYLRSEEVDSYIRTINGTTQINVTDLKKIPFPAVEQLMKMGLEIEGCNHEYRSIGKRNSK